MHKVRHASYACMVESAQTHCQQYLSWSCMQVNRLISKTSDRTHELQEPVTRQKVEEEGPEASSWKAVLADVQ